MEGINAILVPLVISAGCGLGMAVFAKICPREKLAAWIAPSAKAAGAALSVVLVRWLGKGNAEKVEEGVICTAAYAIRKWLDTFETTILTDNEKGAKNGTDLPTA